MEVVKTDDDAMNGGDVRALARPFERLVNEIDYDTALEKISPQRRDGNALRDRIGSDKGASSFSAENEVSGFFEPASHVIGLPNPEMLAKIFAI